MSNYFLMCQGCSISSFGTKSGRAAFYHPASRLKLYQANDPIATAATPKSVSNKKHIDH